MLTLTLSLLNFTFTLPLSLAYSHILILVHSFIHLFIPTLILTNPCSADLMSVKDLKNISSMKLESLFMANIYHFGEC